MLVKFYLRFVWLFIVWLGIILLCMLLPTKHINKKKIQKSSIKTYFISIEKWWFFFCTLSRTVQLFIVAKYPFFVCVCIGLARIGIKFFKIQMMIIKADLFLLRKLYFTCGRIWHLEEKFVISLIYKKEGYRIMLNVSHTIQ